MFEGQGLGFDPQHYINSVVTHVSIFQHPRARGRRVRKSKRVWGQPGLEEKRRSWDYLTAYVLFLLGSQRAWVRACCGVSCLSTRQASHYWATSSAPNALALRLNLMLPICQKVTFAPFQLNRWVCYHAFQSTLLGRICKWEVSFGRLLWNNYWGRWSTENRWGHTVQAISQKNYACFLNSVVMCTRCCWALLQTRYG